MIELAVKPPTIPIRFHKLLKVVVIVDRPEDPQIRQLLDHIAAEHFEIEIAADFDRDVSEDADVGAYIASIDGECLERARQLAHAARALGFHIPLWGVADSHRITHIAVLGMTGEVEGYIYLGQQTPAFYAKQIAASIGEYGMSLLPPFFGGLMAYDAAANVAFDCPGHQGGQFYRKSPAGQLFFKHFGESIFRNDLCNADVALGDLLVHDGAAAEAERHAARVFGADQTYFVRNGTSTSNKVVTNAVLRPGDLVLFDRNNDKSLHQGALVQAVATRRNDRSGSPASSWRLTTARSTTCARCSRGSGICATTSSGTKRGSDTTRFIRCSWTTVRCGSIISAPTCQDCSPRSRFPGFGHDTHGVENRDGTSYVQCLKIASPRTVSA